MRTDRVVTFVAMPVLGVDPGRQLQHAARGSAEEANGSAQHLVSS
jgi:hypothetical protein